MADELTKYRHMTPDEIREAIHIAIVVNLDKLPQLKGKGKANAADRDLHTKVFTKAVAWHFENRIMLTLADPAWSHSTP